MTGCRIGKVRPKLSVVTPLRFPVNEYAVRLLTDALESVLNGEVLSVGIATINRRRYVSTAYTIEDCHNPVLMHGAVSWLNQRIMHEVEES